jgi:hypothetical protein
VRVRNKKILTVLIILLLGIYTNTILLNLTSVQAQATQPQRFSSLPTNVNDKKDITNSTFWKWIKDYIGPKGYKDMIFIFGECYGGGFVNSLPDGSKLPATVAMSASSYSEESNGWTDGHSGGAYDLFLQGVTDALRSNPGGTADAIFNAAAQADIINPNSPKYTTAYHVSEHPQIRHSDNTSISFHDGHSNYAILYGGNPNGERHWNDLDRFYAVLRNNLHYSASDIKVLYGDGTNKFGSTTPINSPATVNNLENTIKNLPMNSTETLLFWVSDHGDNDAHIDTGYNVFHGYSSHTFNFNLYSDFIRSVSLSTVIAPSFVIPLAGISNNLTTVYINGVYIGNLTTVSVNTIFFSKNQVVFSEFNNNLTISSGQSTDFAMWNFTLDSGSVPTQTLSSVGGVMVPVNKTALLAPYIGLASTILVAAAVTVIYVKRVKRRKEKLQSIEEVE